MNRGPTGRGMQQCVWGSYSLITVSVCCGCSVLPAMYNNLDSSSQMSQEFADHNSDSVFTMPMPWVHLYGFGDDDEDEDNSFFFLLLHVRWSGRTGTVVASHESSPHLAFFCYLYCSLKSWAQQIKIIISIQVVLVVFTNWASMTVAGLIMASAFNQLGLTSMPAVLVTW